VRWRDVPAGAYVVYAAIGHGDQTRATESAHIIVTGS
jgi:hypothetical protein